MTNEKIKMLKQNIKTSLKDKRFYKKFSVDVFVYLMGIILDSLAIFLIIQAGLGASPFGAFSSNLVLIIPITIGMASILFDIANIIIASLLAKERMQIENLLYGFIFAVFLELWFFIIPSFSGLHIVVALLVFVFGVCISDLSKALLNLVKFPKLSSVVTTYAISKRFKINLNWSSKIRNFVIILLAFIFAVISGNPLANLGVGTIATFVVFGYFLKLFDPIVKKIYNKIVNKIYKKEPEIQPVIEQSIEVETTVNN